MTSLIAIIPVYNHAATVGAVVAELHRYQLPVLLIDDGSRDADARMLDALVRDHPADQPLLLLERLPYNQGKGAAVMAGFRRAFQEGYSHAIQVDADGQHEISTMKAFMAASRQHPDAVINGCPQYDVSVPKERLHGRKFCQLWVNINTLSHRIADAMCGFRLYPLAAVLPVVATMAHSKRMEFDIEVIVRLDWAGVPIVNCPVAVHYPADGVSHFDVVRDNLRISWMHTRLFFGMLWRLPRLLRRRRKGK